MQNNIYLCRFCGAQTEQLYKSIDYISREKFLVCYCPVCSIGQTPVLDDIGKYYSKDYYGNRKSITDSFINSVRIWRIEKMFGKTRKLRALDIGAGNGRLVRLLLRNGWEAEGTELAPSKHFENETTTIHQGDFLDIPFREHYFNLITLWHVFEHISRPREYLKKIRSLLDPNGVLIIEVPNLDSIQAKIMGRNWFNLDVPRHLFHFTKDGLVSLLQDEGFSVIKISHYSPIYSEFGLLQSILNWITHSKNIFYDFLNGKITFKNYSMRSIQTWELIITLLLAPFAILITIPIIFFETIFRHGGIIVIYAKVRKF